MGKLTEKVAKGALWKLFERIGIQAAHFVVTLVLARLLTPNDYGTVALMAVFISISDLLLDCGIGTALVRKKDATEVDFNTVFYLNLGLAIVFYLALFAMAPYVAEFYSIPMLTPMMRVLALKVIFQGLNEIQTCVLNRQMLYKLSFKITWTQTAVSAIAGIGLAYAGFGPWALVWSSVAGGFIGMLVRQWVIRWRPSRMFSWKSAKELFSFGWKMSVARMSTTAFNNLAGLCIGKLYTPADLSFMQKGSHMPKLMADILRRSVGTPAFPAMVRMQDDIPRLRQAMRRMLRLTTFMIFPVAVGCAVLAEPLMLTLFGERWLPAAPYVRLTALAVCFRPFDQINYSALTARGRSDIYLKLILFRRLLGLVVLICTLRYGVWTFCFCQAIVMGPLGSIVNAWPNRRLLGYDYLMQLQDVLPSVAMAFMAGLLMYVLGFIPGDPRFLLVPRILFGAAMYLGMAYIFRSAPMGEALGVAASVFKKRLPSLSKTAVGIRGHRWRKGMT